MYTEALDSSAVLHLVIVNSSLNLSDLAIFPNFLGTKYGTEFPCAAGTYTNRSGIIRWEQCENCPEGHYCPQGTAVPKKCPKGKYYDKLSGKALGDCKDCTAGYYCPAEATVTPLPCTRGYYSSSGAFNCTICKPGFYCESNTTSYVTMVNTFVCPAGMHCPAGLNRKPDLVTHACPKGQYCVRGDEVNL